MICFEVARVGLLPWYVHATRLGRMRLSVCLSISCHNQSSQASIQASIDRGRRYAWGVISEWQHRVGGDLGWLLAAAPDDTSRTSTVAHGSRAAARRRRQRGSTQLRRHNSISCMPQLQAKFGSPPSDTAYVLLLQSPSLHHLQRWLGKGNVTWKSNVTNIDTMIWVGVCWVICIYTGTWHLLYA